MTTEFAEPAGPARRRRRRPRHHRLGHDHPGPDQPVRRGHARQPVDPRGHRTGQGRAVRRADRARLPHDVARGVLRAASWSASAGISMGINYGADKVRFPSPVPVGSKLRARGELHRRQGGAGRRADHRAHHDRARGRRQARRDRRRDQPVPRMSALQEAFSLTGKVAIVTGAGPRHRRADREDLRRGRRRRRARGAHQGAARRGRRGSARLRPARARDPVRRERERSARRHRRADDGRVRPHRRGGQQRGRHDAAPVHGHQRRLPRARVPLQLHHRVRADQGGRAAHARGRLGRDRQHLLRDRAAARPRVRRVRHREGRAHAHDAVDGRRPRAEGPRQRDRGRARSRRARSRSCSTTRRSTTRWCGARR